MVIELAPEMASVAQRTARLLGKTYLPVLGDAEIEGYSTLSLSLLRLPHAWCFVQLIFCGDRHIHAAHLISSTNTAIHIAVNFAIETEHQLHECFY